MSWDSHEIDAWFDGDVDAAREMMRYERERADAEIEPCPNCGDTSPNACQRCARYGAHGGRCAHRAR